MKINKYHQQLCTFKYDQQLIFQEDNTEWTNNGVSMEDVHMGVTTEFIIKDGRNVDNIKRYYEYQCNSQTQNSVTKIINEENTQQYYN